MKLFWLAVFGIASCKAAITNNYASRDDRRTDPIIEIRFVSAAASYSAVIGILQKNGFNPQIEYYPVNTADRSVVILSFQGYDISGEDLARLKKIIGSCRGVIDVGDVVVN